jgi:cytochrome c553
LMLMLLLINFTGFVLRWDDRGSWALLVGTNLIRAAAPERTPDPRIDEGRLLFTEGAEGAPACSVCHSLTGEALVGPTLQDISQSASRRLSGMSAEDYLYNSIVSPNTYQVPGYESGSMYQFYGSSLSEQQIDALVAFLMTQ